MRLVLLGTEALSDGISLAGLVGRPCIADVSAIVLNWAASLLDARLVQLGTNHPDCRDVTHSFETVVRAVSDYRTEALNDHFRLQG